MSGSTEQIGILVVDDERAVLGWVASVLKKNGYAITLAESAADALQAVDGADARLKLLITDISMPEMDGIELARRVRRKRPDIRVVYMTGYTDHVVPSDTVVLHKPFTPQALVREVARALASG